MNSIFNEQPTRKITAEFIEKAVGDASSAYSVSSLPLHFGMWKIPTYQLKVGILYIILLFHFKSPGTVQQASSGVSAFRFMLESNLGKVGLYLISTRKMFSV